MRMMNQLRSFTGSHNVVDQSTKVMVIEELTNLCSVLGILEKNTYMEAMPEEASRLVKSRDELRKQGKFADADLIRAELKEKYGICIDDTEYGSVWYKN
jgi:cysteinyl-tRNA synthetase